VGWMVSVGVVQAVHTRVQMNMAKNSFLIMG
jgi:hypothetical protein